MIANKQREEIGLAQEIAEQHRGVTVGVVKVPVTVMERWEEMARELEGLPAAEAEEALYIRRAIEIFPPTRLRRSSSPGADSSLPT